MNTLPGQPIDVRRLQFRDQRLIRTAQLVPPLIIGNQDEEIRAFAPLPRSQLPAGTRSGEGNK